MDHEGQHQQACRIDGHGSGQQAVGAESGAQARQHEGGGHGPSPRAAQQETEGRGTQPQAVDGQGGQEGEGGAAEEDEAAPPQEDHLEGTAVAGVAEAYLHGSTEALGGQVRGDHGPAPTFEHHQHAHEGDGIEREGPGGAEEPHDEAP